MQKEGQSDCFFFILCNNYFRYSKICAFQYKFKTRLSMFKGTHIIIKLLEKNLNENLCPCIVCICSGERHKEISKYTVKSNNEETRSLET